MSKDNILVPSAKVILNYREGNFRYNEIHEFFRFHAGDVIYWIEKCRGNFEVCVRGFDCDKFEPFKRVLFQSHDLDECIDKFYFFVNWSLNDKMR